MMSSVSTSGSGYLNRHSASGVSGISTACWWCLRCSLSPVPFCLVLPTFLNMKGWAWQFMSGMVACGMLFCLASGDFDRCCRLRNCLCGCHHGGGYQLTENTMDWRVGLLWHSLWPGQCRLCYRQTENKCSDITTLATMPNCCSSLAYIIFRR